MSLPKIVQEVADAYGGSTKLAVSLGIKPPAIYQWTRVPERWVRQVAETTGIPLHELRPDLFPPPAEEG